MNNRQLRGRVSDPSNYNRENADNDEIGIVTPKQLQYTLILYLGLKTLHIRLMTHCLIDIFGIQHMAITL